MWPFRRRPAAVPEAVAAVVDDIAVTYAAHPGFTARLLEAHSNAVLALDAAVLDPHSVDHETAMAASEADATRRGLLMYCTTPEGNR